MRIIMKFAFLLLFIGLSISCDKIDNPDHSSSLITLVVENNTDEDFDNFSFTVYDYDLEMDVIQDFGSIKAGKSAEISYDKTLEYMHYGDENEFMQFGNIYIANVDGVEKNYNNGFCGTGLFYEKAESGVFVTEVVSIDHEYDWLGIKQKKL